MSEKMQLNEILTLEKAARMARESEAVRKQQLLIREGDKKEVEVIRIQKSQQREFSKQIKERLYKEQTCLWAD